MIHRIVSLGISGIVHELRYRLKRRRPSHPPSLEPGATPLVSVLCATNRPEQLAHLLATFDTQTWTNRELIVVTNADGFDLSAIAERQDVLVAMRAVDEGVSQHDFDLRCAQQESCQAAHPTGQ